MQELPLDDDPRFLLSPTPHRRGPLHLSHLVTTSCDCRCPTRICRDNRSEELGTREIADLYQQAGDAGMVTNALWGGEALLREDLERLCRASREAGMITTVITNGYRLPERAEELSREIDCIIGSLDYPEPGRHDAFRGMPGLFDRALDGIRALRRTIPYPKVIVNCLRRGDPCGNVRVSRLDEILARWDRQEVVRGARGCHSCVNPNAVDTSYVWGLHPEPLLNAMSLFFSR